MGVPGRDFFFGRPSGNLSWLLRSEIPTLLSLIGFWPEASHDIKLGDSCQATELLLFF